MDEFVAAAALALTLLFCAVGAFTTVGYFVSEWSCEREHQVYDCAPKIIWEPVK